MTMIPVCHGPGAFGITRNRKEILRRKYINRSVKDRSGWTANQYNSRTAVVTYRSGNPLQMCDCLCIERHAYERRFIMTMRGI
jgi:hypothetical protein